MNKYDIIVNNKVVETIEQQGRSNGAMIYIIMDRVYQLTAATKEFVEVFNRSTGLYTVFKRGVLRGRKLMLQDTAGEWIELKRAAKYYEEDMALSMQKS